MGTTTAHVRTGENAFRHLHGKDTWQFRAGNADEPAIFDAAMRESSARSIPALLSNYDFSGFKHIVDVGGGDGTLIATLLVHNSSLRGTLLDLPHVIARPKSGFAHAGVADRANAIPGSFFEQVPSGGDVYLLKHVIHNWEDAQALAILRACRHASTLETKLLLIERAVSVSSCAPDTALADLNLLVNAGGRERTLEQFGKLLADASFRFDLLVPLPTGHCVIEARGNDFACGQVPTGRVICCLLLGWQHGRYSLQCGHRSLDHIARVTLTRGCPLL